MSQNLGDSAPITLPIDFDLRPKNTVPPCKSRKVQVLPLSGSIFSPGDVAKWELPCGRAGEFLDGSQTYLLLRVRNTDTVAPWFVDGSAVSFINKLEVFSSSQLIETISSYNILYQIMLDTQSGPMDRFGQNSLLLGCDQDESADFVNFSRGGVAVAPGQTATFAIPIFSGVIGSGCSKFLPIGDLQDLRVEITFENNAAAVMSGTTTAVSTNIWQVTFAELAIQVISVDDSVHRLMGASRGNAPVMISSQSYRNYNTVLNANNISDSTIIPLKFTSCKSLFGCYRNSTNLNVFNAGTITSRKNPFASGHANNGSVNLQVLAGNDYLPQVPLRSSYEIYAEYNKAWHMLNNINNKTTINRETYDQMLEPNNFGAITWTSATTTINAVTASSVSNGIVTPGIITTAAAHGLGAGNYIFYTGATTGGLVQNTWYYVLSAPNTTQLILSLNPRGMPITTTVLSAQTLAFTGYTSPIVLNTGGSVSSYWNSAPSFVWGLNTDTLYQQSATSMSGINTQSGNVFLNGTYSLSTPVSMRSDIFAHYDFILVIDPNTKQMSIRI